MNPDVYLRDEKKRESPEGRELVKLYTDINLRLGLNQKIIKCQFKKSNTCNNNNNFAACC